MNELGSGARELRCRTGELEVVGGGEWGSARSKLRSGKGLLRSRTGELGSRSG